METPFERRVFKSDTIEETTWLDNTDCFAGRNTLFNLFAYSESWIRDVPGMTLKNRSIYMGVHCVAGGRCELLSGDSSTLLNAGHVFFARPGNGELRLRIPRGVTLYRRTLLLVDSMLFSYMFGSPDVLESNVVTPRSPERYSELLDRIGKLVRGGGNFLREDISMLVYAALDCLRRPEHPLEHDLRARINDAVMRNPSGFGSVERLMEFSGLSRRALFRFFKRNFNRTPMNFVIHCRLERSRWYLLYRRELSVSEIARICGYRDFAFFSREFRRKYGVPPMEYRRDMYDSQYKT